MIARLLGTRVAFLAAIGLMIAAPAGAFLRELLFDPRNYFADQGDSRVHELETTAPAA